MLSGTLTIGARHAHSFSLPFEGSRLKGDHSNGRYTGLWEQVVDCKPSLPSEDPNELCLMLPHRDRRICTTWEYQEQESDPVHHANFLSALETLDSDYEGMTQTQKLNQVVDSYHGGPAAVVLNTISTHSSFALVSLGVPISLIGLFDPQLGSAHLVWAASSEGLVDLPSRIRSNYPLQYLVYRFPVLIQRAVFLPTQVLCAHWSRYLKQASPLLAFNALELKIFK